MVSVARLHLSASKGHMDKPTALPNDESTALLLRFRKIESWCDGRGIKQWIAFFRGGDSRITDHELRMGYVSRAKAPRMFDTDEEWIGTCERIMHLFKNYKQAA